MTTIQDLPVGHRFYPFVLAVVPILHIVANNPGWSSLDDVAVTSVAVLAGCGIVYSLAALAAGRRRAGRFAPLVVLAAVVWFWGYPGLVDLVGRRGSIATHLLLLPVCLAGTSGLGWWLLRRPALLDRLATFLALTGALLVGWSALSIGLARRRSARAIRESAVVRRLAQPIQVRSSATHGPARDIYVIVMDEYANADVTTERFAFDNHVFLDSLRRLGFVVPTVHSNYLHTALSIPSLLNASQLTGLAGEVGTRAEDVSILHYLVENNRTVAFLKARGYRFVFFRSHWWLATRHNRHADAEIDVWSGRNILQEVSRSHLRRTLRKASLLDLLQPEAAWNAYADHYTRTIRAIAGIPKTPGPTLVFAHLLMPHLPFVVDRECRPLHRRAGAHGEGSESRYVGQVECLNRMMLELVTTLLRTSDVPPVILLQGDHGTKTLKFEEARSAETISPAAARERLGAFGAYYLPDHGAEAFGDSVTIVNVLGNVLRYYLGADLPREPDDMYLSLGAAPFAFKRVDPAWLTRTAGSHAP